MNWEIWGGIFAGVVLFSILVYLGSKALKSQKNNTNDDTENEATEKKRRLKGKETSKSVWWPRLVGTGIVLLALFVVFSAYQHFFPTTSNSILSRTPAGTNMSHSVPMEIALPIIADCETGGGVAGAAKQFIDEEKKIPMRNPQDGNPGTGAVGKWQINLSDKTIAGIVNTNKWNVESSESDNRLAAEHLYREYRTNPWTASQSCWEPKLRAYTWGGEAVSLVVKAPINEWSKPSIPLTHKGETADLSGLGKKYTVRWNEGRSDQVDEDLPRAVDVAPKNPAVAYSFRLKSRESEPVNVLVKLY